jgi:hypothetical protein
VFLCVCVKVTRSVYSLLPSFPTKKTEANYHTIIQRNPIREKTDAWQRVLKAENSANVPPELEEWVKAATLVLAAEAGEATPFFATVETETVEAESA